MKILTGGHLSPSPGAYVDLLLAELNLAQKSRNICLVDNFFVVTMLLGVKLLHHWKAVLFPLKC